MTEFNDKQQPSGLEDVARQLREWKAEPSPLQLDQIQMRVNSRASGAKRMPNKARLVTMLLVVAVTGSSGAAVIAATAGSGGQSSAAATQYCKKGEKPKPPKPCRPDD